MAFSKKIYHIMAATLGAVLLIAGMAGAYEDEFASAEKIEGRHVVVYYHKGIDIPALDRQLNIRPSDKILAGKNLSAKSSPEAEFADMLDALFIHVCDILDMQLYTMQVDIKVCQDYGHLSRIYNGLFSSDLGGRKSFYVAGLNAIYISRDSFRREMLGHEMAHAIMSRYFVVQPPVKIQEILAMYVEYNLRKASK